MIEKKSLQTACEFLAKGKIIAVPTDTVPGLAVDSVNQQAINRLYALKGRNFQKPLVWMLSSLDKVKELAHISDWTIPILEKNWPGPLTVIFKAKKNTGKESIGIRIPAKEELLDLLASWNQALVVTSANESGKADLLSMIAIRQVFGDKIGWYWPGNHPASGKPSTIIDVTGDKLKVLRQGELVLS